MGNQASHQLSTTEEEAQASTPEDLSTLVETEDVSEITSPTAETGAETPSSSTTAEEGTATKSSSVNSTTDDRASSVDLNQLALRNLRNKHEGNTAENMNRCVVPRDRKTKRSSVNKDQLVANAKELFSLETNTQDALLAVLSSATGNGTVWERRMSPFFVLCSILKVDPMCVSTKEGTEREVLRRGALKNNGWTVPVSGSLPKQLKPIFDEGYSMILQAYEHACKRIESSHSLRMDGMDELNTSPLPPYPHMKWYSSVIRFARLNLNKLWYADPRSEDMDVRHDILRWATENLKEMKSEEEFKAMVNWHVDYQICRRIQSEKALVMPDKCKDVAMFCDQNRNCS